MRLCLSISKVNHSLKFTLTFPIWYIYHKLITVESHTEILAYMYVNGISLEKSVQASLVKSWSVLEYPRALCLAPAYTYSGPHSINLVVWSAGDQYMASATLMSPLACHAESWPLVLLRHGWPQIDSGLINRKPIFSGVAQDTSLPLEISTSLQLFHQH